MATEGASYRLRKTPDAYAYAYAYAYAFRAVKITLTMPAGGIVGLPPHTCLEHKGAGRGLAALVSRHP